MKYKELKEPIQDVVRYLLVFSMSPERQKEIHGIGDPGGEMSDYVLLKEGFLSDLEKIRANSLISETLISELVKFFSELNAKDFKFWSEYENSDEWNLLRNRAKNLYLKFGIEELEIITEFDVRYTKGGILQMQNLFLIIEKNFTDQELQEAIKQHLTQAKN